MNDVTLSEERKEEELGTRALGGKVAFVTGASSGIGAAVARALAKEGVKLGLVSRRGNDLGIEGALAQVCDVRSIAQLEAAVAATVKRFGGLDIVIANAGVGSYRPVLDTSLEEIEEMIDVNVKGLIYTVRACVPHLLQRGGGGHSHGCLRGGSARTSVGGRLRGVEIRASRLHTLWITSCELRGFAARISVREALRPISGWGGD